MGNLEPDHGESGTRPWGTWILTMGQDLDKALFLGGNAATGQRNAGNVALPSTEQTDGVRPGVRVPTKHTLPKDGIDPRIPPIEKDP
jgi:hypothetical protein